MVHMMIDRVYTAVAWEALLGIVLGNEGSARPTSKAIADWAEDAVDNECRRRQKDGLDGRENSQVTLLESPWNLGTLGLEGCHECAKNS